MAGWLNELVRLVHRQFMDFSLGKLFPFRTWTKRFRAVSDERECRKQINMKTRTRKQKAATMRPKTFPFFVRKLEYKHLFRTLPYSWRESKEPLDGARNFSFFSWPRFETNQQSFFHLFQSRKKNKAQNMLQQPKPSQTFAEEYEPATRFRLSLHLRRS